MKCFISSGSISSQRPAFFSSKFAVKIHDSQAYRNMEMTMEHISFTCDLKDTFVILPNGLQLCKSCNGLCNAWENLVWNHHLKQLLRGTKACYSTQLLPFYLYLSLDAFGTVCHQFGLFCTDLHLKTLCRFCRDFLLGLLAFALPQLEHLCHRQTADL